MQPSLTDLLARDYPLRLIPDPDGGYVFEYPDLPGCIGQIESLAELPEHAEEARGLWLEVARERGNEIPLPSRPEEYSGKLVVRMPRSLHRRLAESAAADSVSLNAYIGTLLAAGEASAEVRGRFDEVCANLDALHDRLPVSFAGIPRPLRVGPAEAGADFALAA